MSASASLIPELEDVIQHGSAERRAKTVQRIANLFIDGAPQKIVTGFNFWRLRRERGRWRIVRRFARRLGDGDVPALFAPIVRRLLGR